MATSDAAPVSGLDRVRVVLVDTLEPGNIGAAARAMKTMGLTRLTLVRPTKFPHVLATRMAVSAADVLERAQRHADLPAALAGSFWVYGVSARQRSIPLPVATPRELGFQVLHRAQHGDIAIVFGGEEAGLSNADLALCATLVQIPSAADCRSLNLAAAVQLIAWELRMASLGTLAAAPTPPQAAPLEDFEQMLASFDTLLADAGYYANKNHALTLEKLRRMLQRGAFDMGEVRMLRGVIAQLGKGTRKS